MIKINELRFGNFILYKKEMLQWKAANAHQYFKLLVEKPELFEGIELTAEIILKSGCTGNEFDDDMFFTPSFTIQSAAGGGYEQVFDSYVIGKPMKYLHELQNREHSMSGVEISI